MNLPPRAGLSRRLAYGEFIRNSTFTRTSLDRTSPFNRIYGFNYETLSRLSLIKNPKVITIKDLLENTTLKISNIQQFCAICQDDINQNAIIRILKCKHNFHVNCIDRWFCENIKCPLCNKLQTL